MFGPLSRDDTIFGVCEALGEDFGFSANFLRILLGAGLLFSPFYALAAYGVGAVLVAAARWLVPDPPQPDAEIVHSAEAAGEVEFELPLAA